MIDTTTTDQLRHDPAPLLDALRQAGADVSNPRKIRCPFHEDDHPSAGIYADGDGVHRFKCHGCDAGGDVFDVRARVSGRSVEDELRDARDADAGTSHSAARKAKPAPKVYPTLEALAADVVNVVQIDPYRWPSGDIHGAELRIEPGRDGRSKDIIQAKAIPDGFTFGGPAAPHPPFNVRRVLDAERVVDVEGPKAARALQRLGIVATTNLAGAGKAKHTDWSPLAGKTVILWPDADAPDPKTGQRTGIAHMREVSRLLDQLDPPPRVLWLDPDLLDLPDKGDAHDFIARLADLDAEQRREAVEQALGEAVPMGASSEVSALISDAIAGRRFVVPWPWPTLGKLSRALAPATVTLLVASPGATKSIVLIEAAQHWHDAGHKPAVLELEDGRAFHLRRALAQRAGIADLTDDDWCREHPETAREADRQHAHYLDAFGRCIHELSGDDQPTLTAIADWIEAQAIAGKRVIVVDPISIAEQTHEQYRADQAFTARVKRIAEQTGCSIVLVMHPRKGAQGQTVDDIAGGAGYGRLAQTVLWLDYWPEAKHVTVREPTMNLNIEAEANRAVRIAKARNGRGQGMRIGFYFDTGTLRLHERGALVKRGDGGE